MAWATYASSRASKPKGAVVRPAGPMRVISSTSGAPVLASAAAALSSAAAASRPLPSRARL